MIEFDKSEELQSDVEDSELIAILSLYEELSPIEAIAIKDKLLYKDVANGRPVGDAARDIQFRSDLEYGNCVAARIPETKRREA